MQATEERTMGLTEEEKAVIRDRIERGLKVAAERKALHEKQRLVRRGEACCTELADAVEYSLAFKGQIGGVVKIVDDPVDPALVYDVRFCPFCGTKL